jgi:hypothetical protein
MGGARMQMDHNANPMERIRNFQEERVSSVSLLSHSRTPGITDSSIWIDPVVQQNISATSFTHETSQHALPSPVSPTSSALHRHGSTYLKNVAKVRLRPAQNSFISWDTDVMGIPIQPQPTMWQYEKAKYEAASSLSSLSLIVTDMLPAVSLDPQAHSPQAGEVNSHQRGRSASTPRSSLFNLLYHLRWWLLISGHLELLLWCSGILLFASIICIFLFPHHAYWG